jgi:hypothetical protein
MTQDLKQHVERLVEYANSIRERSEVVEYVLARFELLKSSKSGSATVLVVANPLAGEDGGVDSEVVSAWMPHFQEYVAHRIRHGYLPLGIINIDTGLPEVFVAMVPEAYRHDIVRFANSEFQYICDALAVMLSSSVGPETLN